MRLQSEINDNELEIRELRQKSIQIAKEKQSIAASEINDNDLSSVEKEERIKNVALVTDLENQEQLSRVKDWQSVTSYQVDRSSADIANRLIDEEQKRRLSLIESSLEEEKAVRILNRQKTVSLLDSEIV